MNEFDLLLAFVVFLGVVFGAIRGGSKQIVGLVSIWLALIIDLRVYKVFSVKILQGQFKTASPVVMDSFSFILFMIIITAAIQLIFIFTTKPPEEKRRKKVKDLNDLLDKTNKGSGTTALNIFFGLFTGFLGTVLWLSIGLALLQYLLASVSGGGAVKASMANSMLLPYFNTALQYLYLSVKFFAPGELPAIFSAVL